MTLKKVLLINAISSGVTGIQLALMPNFFANLFKVSYVVPFVEVGIFLILFSLFVLATAFKNPNQKSWTKLIIGMDITWVIASIIAVILLFQLISIVGSVIILAVAGWVGLMAYLQNRGLQNI
ncbi:hypothetical protein H8S90_09950 [Olivibacter sp. SDN3]|uniref:hypothetical protein n=1 Tax=Olivibacter sp. SDN3 TaxID=2764720 RepID=UPI001650E6E4|nr:hypothetical protein [Olivibacter sp. SDN3]QNL51864.1 hypothetical protein H8S90_09950 [Olivibacter sp. SDN3]